jgi:multidrug resistance protein MdtO
MREAIYRHFGEVNAQSDAVPFETGPLRPGDMAARDRIRRWQSSLRSFYLLEAPLLQFRMFGQLDRKSQSFTAFENDFRLECSRIFLHIAENLEGQFVSRIYTHSAVASLVKRLDSSPPQLEQEISERERSLSRLMRTIAQVVDRFQFEAASVGLYEVPMAATPLSQPAESQGT